MYIHYKKRFKNRDAIIAMQCTYYSWCSFSMMVKWANGGLLQANDGEMLVNDVEMLVNDGGILVNDGEMSIWSYTHFTIIDLHFTIISLQQPSLAHLTIIEKLHRLYYDDSIYHDNCPYSSTGRLNIPYKNIEFSPVRNIETACVYMNKQFNRNIESKRVHLRITVVSWCQKNRANYIWYWTQLSNFITHVSHFYW